MGLGLKVYATFKVNVEQAGRPVLQGRHEHQHGPPIIARCWADQQLLVAAGAFYYIFQHASCFSMYLFFLAVSEPEYQDGAVLISNHVQQGTWFYTLGPNPGK
jgi:hypothetical protein